MKRQQSSCWLFCQFMEGQQRKNNNKTFWITAVWRPLTQMCRWSWHQWLPGAGHSSLWWFSAGMSTAGTVFSSVAARTAGCVFVVDVGWWLELFFSVASARDENWELHNGSYRTILFFLADLPHLLSSHLWNFQQIFTLIGKRNRLRALTSSFVATPPCWKHTPWSPSCKW